MVVVVVAAAAAVVVVAAAAAAVAVVPVAGLEHLFCNSNHSDVAGQVFLSQYRTYPTKFPAKDDAQHTTH